MTANMTAHDRYMTSQRSCLARLDDGHDGLILKKNKYIYILYVRQVDSSDVFIYKGLKNTQNPSCAAFLRAGQQECA
jgi:hypothetical protein